MSNRKTPMITKKKSFETYILPCVMYASETITWNKVLMEKFELFQNNIMRICVNKRKLDRISIKNLINMAKFTTITTLIKQRKLRLSNTGGGGGGLGARGLYLQFHLWIFHKTWIVSSSVYFFTIIQKKLIRRNFPPADFIIRSRKGNFEKLEKLVLVCKLHRNATCYK